MAAPDPLSPALFLRRNPRRVLPVFGIQLLVTTLMVAIVTSINAFEATSDAYLKPLEQFTIVAPRHRVSLEGELEAVLDENPAMAERVRAKTLWMRTPMLIGEGRAPLLALAPEAQPDFMGRLRVRLVDGVLPEPGTDGAAVHEAVLRARGMGLGDTFGQNVNADDVVLDKFTVVGVLGGASRIGLVDLAYTSRPDSVLARLPPFEVVYAEEGRKAESDAWLKDAETTDGEAAFRVFDEAFLRERTERSMENLPLLLGFITISIACVVAFVTALLNVIGFQGRVDEFGIYLAVGHRRGPLVNKLALEAGLVAFAGWIVGVGLGLLVLLAFKAIWLEPKGILLWVVDARPIGYSFSVPVLSALVSALALARRLGRMDPVAIIQRRGLG
ncbi:MAG: ABC transporter permease [Planctomycetota bacterium]|nr:ABC transporter permease [Planctomycetota bacterium]